jgi:3-deoxy-D-manno-octulosonate 8-phosphate phosphatase (KDO 8-P phosphatase)
MASTATNLLSVFKSVTCLIFDIDGVLTDGHVMVYESGEQVRRMSVKDGYALELAVKKQYPVAVVSGGNGVGARQRLLKLGIKDVFLQVSDKKKKVEEYLLEKNLSWENALYMGDDIPDYHVMKKVGMPCAPADAAAEVLQVSKYISPHRGGSGCVRDVIEKVLRLHGRWDLETPMSF